MQDSVSTLESRITRLEQKNRLMILFFICFACLAFLLGADAIDTNWMGKKATAEEFVLTNPDGDVRARLAIGEEGGADLRLMDKNGTVRLFLTANGLNNKENATKGKNSPGVVLYSSENKPALIVGQNRDSGIGSVLFFDNGDFKHGVGFNNSSGK